MDPLTVAFGLAQLAPQIIRWITGSERAESAAAQVVQIAQAVTGRPTGQEALQALQGLLALQADPALVLQYRQAVLAQAAELDRAYLADRQDARARDVALAKAGRLNVRADVMVAVDALGLLACLVVLALYRQGQPGKVVTLITTIASIFGLCLRDAHQFEFGSSRGSQEKTELLGRKGPPG
jgi:hypothetical protein